MPPNKVGTPRKLDPSPVKTGPPTTQGQRHGRRGNDRGPRTADSLENL